MRRYAVSEGLFYAEIAGDKDMRKAAKAVLGSSEWQSSGLSSIAHRTDFKEVKRRPGFLYVANRAISSRTNRNFDHFTAEDLASTDPGEGYRTFIGRPVFVEHENDNHRRTRGVNIAAALHDDINPDGSPDTWVKVLKEIDPVAFPKLAKHLLNGSINRTSMGVDFKFSLCSKCGNQAFTEAEYCEHLPIAKGAFYEEPNQRTGGVSQRRVVEVCRKLSFFEDTFIVTNPADPTAVILGVDSSHLPKSRATSGSTLRAAASQKTRALRELVLPHDVNTLARDICPICGGENTFAGGRCSVCGAIEPPHSFMEPDTDVAGRVQQMVDEQMGDGEYQDGDETPDGLGVDHADPDVTNLDGQEQPDLECDNCGATFFSAQQDMQDGQPFIAPAANQAPAINDFAPLDALTQEQHSPDYNATDNPSTAQEAQEEALEQEQAQSDMASESDEGWSEDAQCPVCGVGQLLPIQELQGAPGADEGSQDGDPDADPDDDGLHSHGSAYRQSISTNVEMASLNDHFRRTPVTTSRRATPNRTRSNVQTISSASVVSALNNLNRRLKRNDAVMLRQAALIDVLQTRNETLERQMAHMAAVSGQGKPLGEIATVGRKRAALIMRRAASAANPAQPVGEPQGQPAPESEWDAMQPGAMTDVTAVGSSPLTNVMSDAMTSVTEPYGVYANTPLGLNRTDLTVPVAGTQYQVPPNMSIVPVDVRAAQSNPETAYPWTIGPNGQPAVLPPGSSVGNPPSVGQVGESVPEEKKAYAAMRLARLRIEAKVAQGDDLSVAAAIDSSGMSIGDIHREINTLTQVAAANRPGLAGPSDQTRYMVPQMASTASTSDVVGRTRTMPSMASTDAASNIRITPGVNATKVSKDELLFI